MYVIMYRYIIHIIQENKIFSFICIFYESSPRKNERGVIMRNIRYNRRNGAPKKVMSTTS